MIIGNEQDVTPAVLAEAERAPDPRFREILSAAIVHLHAFVRDARLTENEFRNLCTVIARLGQLHDRVAQRGHAGRGLARRVGAGVPAQQRRQAARAPRPI